MAINALNVTLRNPRPEDADLFDLVRAMVQRGDYNHAYERLNNALANPLPESPFIDTCCTVAQMDADQAERFFALAFARAERVPAAGIYLPNIYTTKIVGDLCQAIDRQEIGDPRIQRWFELARENIHRLPENHRALPLCNLAKSQARFDPEGALVVFGQSYDFANDWNHRRSITSTICEIASQNGFPPQQALPFLRIAFQNSLDALANDPVCVPQNEQILIRIATIVSTVLINRGTADQEAADFLRDIGLNIFDRNTGGLRRAQIEAVFSLLNARLALFHALGDSMLLDKAIDLSLTPDPGLHSKANEFSLFITQIKTIINRYPQLSKNELFPAIEKKIEQQIELGNLNHAERLRLYSLF